MQPLQWKKDSDKIKNKIIFGGYLMKKRLLSLLLALCLLCSMLPITAFAASSQPVYVAFSSDVHSKTTNASDSGHSPYRLNNWLTKVSQAIGATFDNMVFCGDNAGVGSFDADTLQTADFSGQGGEGLLGCI